MKSLFVDFLEGLDIRFPDDSSRMAMSTWIETHTHLRQKPFSFAKHPFQRQIADDMSPDMSVIKISQVGATEVQLRKYFGFLKRNVGTAGIFAMPTQPMRDRLSQTRVKSLIESEDIFNGNMVDKPVRQKGIYQIDLSFGYFTGSTEGEATSIPADILFVDEIDLADQSMIGLFQSRLQASAHKITQRFSTPTYHAYGIDGAFSASDQHDYAIRCDCGHWQVPEFHPKFLCLPGFDGSTEDLTTLSNDDINAIDLAASYVRCERCSRQLDLGDGSRREWIAKHPSRVMRGYRIKPFSTTSLSPAYIFQQLIRYRLVDNLRGFYNTVLGEAYNDGNARLSEEDIAACLRQPLRPDPLPSGGMFLGADMGATCHIAIGTAEHIVEMAQVPQAEVRDFIRGRMSTYPIIAGCVDMYPYTPLSEEIRDTSQQIIMPVGYATTHNAPPLNPQKDEFDTVTHFVAHRTKAIDAVAKVIRNHTLNISGYGPHRSLLIAHLRDMVRVEHPDQPPKWEKLSGQDHFFHAITYHQLAVRLKAGLDYNSDADERNHVFIRGSNSGLLNDKSEPLYISKYRPEAYA